MPDYRITIDVKDVAPGDMRALRDGILEKWGDDFDAARGDFEVQVLRCHRSASQPPRFFFADLDED